MLNWAHEMFGVCVMQVISAWFLINYFSFLNKIMPMFWLIWCEGRSDWALVCNLVLALNWFIILYIKTSLLQMTTSLIEWHLLWYPPHRKKKEWHHRIKCASPVSNTPVYHNAYIHSRQRWERPEWTQGPETGVQVCGCVWGGGGVSVLYPLLYVPCPVSLKFHCKLTPVPTCWTAFLTCTSSLSINETPLRTGLTRLIFKDASSTVFVCAFVCVTLQVSGWSLCCWESPWWSDSSPSVSPVSNLTHCVFRFVHITN